VSESLKGADWTAAPQRVYERAFDGLADAYDTDFTARPDAQAVRRAVWRELEARVRAPQLVVELGCGTGTDARFLAGRGLRVLATDLSRAMVDHARDKLHEFAATARAEHCDLARASIEVPRLLGATPFASAGEPIDAILSNFGPLNCVASVDPVFALADRLLAPGGWLFCCLINRLYARELARGVLRRFRPSGSLVRCGGEQVPLFYHRLSDFRRPGYDIDAVVGLAVFGRSDVHRHAPLNRCGDHVLIIARRRSAAASASRSR
jgi:SAM-dependent methyltransferase